MLSILKFFRSRGILAILAVISISSRLGAQIETRPFVHNGYSRPYLVYKPQHLPPHPAAVFMLGGIRSTAVSESENFGWIAEADRNGFLAVFPDPVATDPRLPVDHKTNITFWEMAGSRTHLLGPGMLSVDDDGYLAAVLHDVFRRDRVDRRRVFFAGFSSGSGMVQLFASRHSREVTAIAAAATPLMQPPEKLAHPVAVLYLHGDEDEQFSGFETNSPKFATSPHGNWVTWGYLNGCTIQTAEKTSWGIQLSWKNCKRQVPVVANFYPGLGHEWAGSLDAGSDPKYGRNGEINFTDLAWQFFASLQTR